MLCKYLSEIYKTHINPNLGSDEQHYSSSYYVGELLKIFSNIKWVDYNVNNQVHYYYCNEQFLFYKTQHNDIFIRYKLISQKYIRAYLGNYNQYRLYVSLITDSDIDINNIFEFDKNKHAL